MHILHGNPQGTFRVDRQLAQHRAMQPQRSFLLAAELQPAPQQREHGLLGHTTMRPDPHRRQAAAVAEINDMLTR